MQREWWEGLIEEDQKEWWEEYFPEEVTLTSIELTHPSLKGGSILLTRMQTGWTATAINWKNGKQSDPTEELARRNLVIEQRENGLPILVEQRVKVPEACPKCFSEEISFIRPDGVYLCKCKRCFHGWRE